MPDLPSGTITFLFTDIEGSTARWERGVACATRSSGAGTHGREDELSASLETEQPAFRRAMAAGGFETAVSTTRG